MEHYLPVQRPARILDGILGRENGPSTEEKEKKSHKIV